MDKNNGAIYDARKLGKPKMIILGVQHMFAMFGATILVPILTGLDISTTLLMAGLGTLLFHCITKFKVPAFLGSSFAFLGGYAAITLSPLAVASIAGIVLNAVFPGKDYKFDTEDVADAANFEKEVKPKEKKK